MDRNLRYGQFMIIEELATGKSPLRLITQFVEQNYEFVKDEIEEREINDIPVPAVLYDVCNTIRIRRGLK